jgi:mono/diheme cytochrome c family protein
MIRPILIRAILLCWVAAISAAAPAAWAMDRPEYLARAGDCTSCHTSPGGKPFAGGLRMMTPLGPIYTTNITPDKITGIGAWRFADFDRAMRRGIARDGHHLYPAMPYPSFAKLSDADMRGLYDYLMTEVAPVRQPNRPSGMIWPLDMRWPLALWNLLFADPVRFQPRPERGAVWNRGAYLVEGLGHCGACHTPRGIAWNEQALDGSDPRFLAGETLDFWSAPDLRGDVRTGLGAWSAAEIVAFLKTGHNRAGMVFGSMNLVTGNSTPFLNDADRAAIAAYLKALPPNRPGERRYVHDDATQRELRANPAVSPGTALYLGQCGRCHGANGMGDPGRVPPLAGNPIVLGRDPTSAIHIVLDGSPPAGTGADQAAADRMPAFRAMLTDAQIASVVSFIRDGWGNRAAAVGPVAVATVRAGTRPAPEQIARGAALVAARGCGACHEIPGIQNAVGLVGPPLDTIGERTIIAGLLANTPDNMALWLQAPQRIKPGDAMPDIGLGTADAQDIAAFLGTLRNEAR